MPAIILTILLGGCKLNNLGDFPVVLENNGLVIAYDQDHLYRGERPPDEGLQAFLDASEVVRRESPNQNCVDFGDVSWLRTASSPPQCGDYTVEILEVSQNDTYRANLWYEDGSSEELPNAEIIVEAGLLKCIRFINTDGSFFEYRTRENPQDCFSGTVRANAALSEQMHLIEN
ncbi:MAG: hypothetical protein ABJN35_14115 [Erythrobacter sp.]